MTVPKSLSLQSSLECIVTFVINSLKPSDTIIVSDNGLSRDRRQAIVWINAAILSHKPKLETTGTIIIIIIIIIVVTIIIVIYHH